MSPLALAGWKTCSSVPSAAVTLSDTGQQCAAVEFSRTVARLDTLVAWLALPEPCLTCTGTAGRQTRPVRPRGSLHSPEAAFLSHSFPSC